MDYRETASVLAQHFGMTRQTVLQMDDTQGEFDGPHKAQRFQPCLSFALKAAEARLGHPLTKHRTAKINRLVSLAGAFLLCWK